MAIRKIDLMHREFGFSPGNKCKTCSNLVSHLYDKRYYKCVLYGESCSEATDWVLKWDACGKYNQEYDGIRIVKLVRGYPVPSGPLEGQESLFDESQP